MSFKIIFLSFIIFSISLSAKKGTIIPFTYPSTTCQLGRIIELIDYDNNGKYEKAFIYNCYLNRIKDCGVVENYNLNEEPGYYFGKLISGEHEGEDFVYIITETQSRQTVAKLYFDLDSYSVIIDKVGQHDESSDLFSDILDEFFNVRIGNDGFVVLTKKKDIIVNELKAVDLNGNEIVTLGYDSNTYSIDLNGKAQGIYFIFMLTSEGYLQKRIIYEK